MNFNVVTWSFKLNPNNVEMNQHVTYLGQRSLSLKLIVWTQDRHTHTRFQRGHPRRGAPNRGGVG